MAGSGSGYRRQWRGLGLTSAERSGKQTSISWCLFLIKLLSGRPMPQGRKFFSQMKNPDDGLAIIHRVHAHEDFNRTAQILLTLLNNAQRQHPGKQRCLYLDIDGHRDAKGDYDHDMHELQTKYMEEFLIHFLTRAVTPSGTFQNPNPQNDNIPASLNLIKIDRHGDGAEDLKPRF